MRCEPTFLARHGTCIDVSRHRSAATGARFRAEAGYLAISTIVLTELLYGVERSAQPERTRRTVEDFVSRLVVLPFDADAAHHASRIRVELQRAGMTIGPYDVLIAGHSRSRGLVVVTGNLREFERVRGIACESWS